MIDVGVRENRGVDLPGVEWEAGIALAGLFPVALIQAAIENAASAVDAEFMHGAGDGLYGSPKGELHNPPV